MRTMIENECHSMFAGHIWGWYFRHKRSLPWRDVQITDDTQRAYMVLVSEVMLQQTQVPRVEVIFKRFLREFPTLADLARASNRDVILAWRGMGYNARALRLRDAARTVIEKFDGAFPRDVTSLRSINGIGPYTAAAILNFAFNIPTPCIDTNIRRIIHRVFTGPEKRDGTWKKNDRILMRTVHVVLRHAMNHRKEHDARNWSAALMDFGSLVCTKRAPRCDVCPLRSSCRSAGKVTITLQATKTKEPGREIAGRFVPNRIIRGRIVEFLRDHHLGASINNIGAHACIDWDAKGHGRWLQQLLEKLQRDGMVSEKKGAWKLAD